MNLNSNKVCVSTPTPECKVERWSPVDEYRNRIMSAKQDLAMRMRDAFECLDALTEEEFLDIMKTMTNDGASACDMLEKFRKWKGL